MVVAELRINTRPFCDALGRLDALARGGALLLCEVAQVMRAVEDADDLSIWAFRPDGTMVLQPAPWLADLIRAAEVR
ncbi:hypothetical protein [Paragemmobacter ruber]|uniref:Uncharacterized protein n=1 Tax=Paragemmobacter ruber TaxID=1985673 RepID=A0ABW9Y0F0_9RHOB|nr:hypothetical protein [Rhodobacter ruber]NBE05949.1 hypothetical protein [Rhodobacter ruber]